MNPNFPDSPARRLWLRRTGGLLAASLGVGTLGSLTLGSRSAYAADYKALVCIYLYGGNDGLNSIVPTDTTRYAQYAAVRGSYLSIPKDRLVGLTGVDYGLHPALAALAPVWDAGHLAPVFNVGPLHAPLTKKQYLAAASDSPLIPESLFSHSDQQALWEKSTSTTMEVKGGWGGRASQTLGTVNPVISIAGNCLFGVEDLRIPLVLPGPGSSFAAAGLEGDDLEWDAMRRRRTALDAMYAQSYAQQMRNFYTQQHEKAFDISARLSEILAAEPGDPKANTLIDTAFADLTSNGQIDDSLAGQLYQVAKLVVNSAAVQGNRQIFFVGLGSFDTHGNQVTSSSPLAGTHAELLTSLGQAMAAFQTAMNNVGLADRVTAFTQSDFGRTFIPNNSLGTDHAWGNHHFIMGGAVKGGKTYGTHPQLVLGGVDDVGQESWELQGRWIPTSSVDQYAATLLQWFGASDSELDTILPNLSNFGSARSLGFV